jgi:hypothetical protein
MSHIKKQDRPIVFEKNIVRILHEEKREEIVGYWIKLHNEELHTLFFSLDIVD